MIPDSMRLSEEMLFAVSTFQVQQMVNQMTLFGAR